MVVLKAFRAIRPRADVAEKVATLPYDVLSSTEARELASENPFSFLHIDKSEVDLPFDIAVHSEPVYQKAAENLHNFLEKGWLKKEDSAELYFYELTMNGRTQTGIVGCTAISDYEKGNIKRHELTLPEKEYDRIQHFDVTNANTSPIFLAYHAQTQIQNLVDQWKEKHEPIYDFTSFYQVRHRVFAVRDLAVIGQIESLFANVSALYIADGHHRSASAVKVGQKRRKEIRDDARAPYNYFLSVIFPDNELEILDYNRVVKTSLPTDFWEKVSEHFDVRKIERAKPAQTHEIHAITADGFVKLTPKDAIIFDDPVKSLDVAILQDYILKPLLGIDDPKTDPNIEFVGGIRGLEALEREIADGASIAFALYPPQMSELLAVADAGKIMPPKSTWFEPKLLSGLFLHDLEE